MQPAGSNVSNNTRQPGGETKAAAGKATIGGSRRGPFDLYQRGYDGAIISGER